MAEVKVVLMPRFFGSQIFNPKSCGSGKGGPWPFEPTKRLKRGTFEFSFQYQGHSPPSKADSDVALLGD